MTPFFLSLFRRPRADLDPRLDSIIFFFMSFDRFLASNRYFSANYSDRITARLTISFFSSNSRSFSLQWFAPARSEKLLLAWAWSFYPAAVPPICCATSSYLPPFPQKPETNFQNKKQFYPPSLMPATDPLFFPILFPFADFSPAPSTRMSFRNRRS
jgi:hypothetical protein